MRCDVIVMMRADYTLLYHGDVSVNTARCAAHYLSSTILECETFYILHFTACLQSQHSHHSGHAATESFSCSHHDQNNPSIKRTPWDLGWAGLGWLGWAGLAGLVRVVMLLQL